MTLPVASLTGTVQPFWLGYLDIDGDEVRVTTLPYDWTPTGTGDPELDGLTFESVPASFVGISPVTHTENGSDTVTASLSGLPGGDTALLTALTDSTKWRGRVARLWRGLADSSFAPGILESYYTGYMMGIAFSGDPTTQTITVTIENYLAVLTTPRRRTYQDQAEHDALDQSAPRIRAAANGIQEATGGRLRVEDGLGGIFRLLAEQAAAKIR